MKTLDLHHTATANCGATAAIATIFDRAKLFSTPPFSAADAFHAEVLTVLVNADGSGVRRTLLDRASYRAVCPGEAAD
jgi:hypothetical protein